MIERQELKVWWFCSFYCVVKTSICNVHVNRYVAFARMVILKHLSLNKCRFCLKTTTTIGRIVNI